MSIQCPTCGSENVRRVTLAYEMGVQKTRNKTIGGGAAFTLFGPIIGVGAAASRGQNTSLFADRFSPPKKVRPILRGFLTLLIGFPIYGIAGLIGISIGSGLSILASGAFGAFCIFVLPILVILLSVQRNKDADRQKKDLDKLFVCECCGEIFEPPLFSQVGENGAQNDNKEPQYKKVGEVLH